MLAPRRETPRDLHDYQIGIVVVATSWRRYRSDKGGKSESARIGRMSGMKYERAGNICSSYQNFARGSPEHF